MADWTKPYSPDFRSGGDLTNEVLAKMIPNETDIYTKLTALRNIQRSASAPSNPNVGDRWECSTTAGLYTADVVYRYNGSSWTEASSPAIASTARNVVLQGKVTALGATDLFTGSTAALTVQINATATPAVFSFMNGNSESTGAVDIIDAVSADDASFWTGLPQNSTVYLYVDYNAGTLTGGFTTVAPAYQSYAPTHAAGKHWIDDNTGKVWSSDGSVWTQRNRIFVGTVTTDGSKCTAQTVYAYNQTRTTMLPIDTDSSFTANSDEKIPTQKAVKSAISAIPSGGGEILNLKIVNNGTTPNTKMDITADMMPIYDSSYNPKILTAVSLTANLGASGTNGLDTGSKANSTNYFLWVISNGSTTAALWSLSATAPTMPSGYTFKRRVGWNRTDSSGNIYRILQLGKRAQYVLTPATNTSQLLTMASGTASAMTAVATGNFIPSTANEIIGSIYIATSAGYYIAVSPNANYTGNSGTGTEGPVVLYTGGTQYLEVLFDFVLESSNIYWAATISTRLYCLGWRDNI